VAIQAVLPNLSLFLATTLSGSRYHASLCQRVRRTRANRAQLLIAKVTWN